MIEVSEISRIEELLVPVFAEGKRQDGSPSIEEMRRRRWDDLQHLDPGVRRLVNPHIYHVSLTTAVRELQQRLVAEALGEG